MSIMPDVPDETTSDWRGGQAGSAQIRLADPPQPNYGGSDLHFIGTVLADLIVFARLNRLEELEEDLAAARTKFMTQVGYVD